MFCRPNRLDKISYLDDFCEIGITSIFQFFEILQVIKNPILTIFAKTEQPQFLEILQVYNGLVKNMYFDDFFEIGIISIFSIF